MYTYQAQSSLVCIIYFVEWLECVCMSLCLRLSLSLCMCVCVCMYVCLCACMYVCACVSSCVWYKCGDKCENKKDNNKKLTRISNHNVRLMHGLNRHRSEGNIIRNENILSNHMMCTCFTFCVRHSFASYKESLCPCHSPNLDRPICMCDPRGIS